MNPGFTEEPMPKLNEVLEQQVREIGQTLHDDFGQLLAAVYLALAEANHRAPPPVRGRLEKVAHLLDQVDTGLRNFTHELHPAVLDDLGLPAALRMLARGVSSRSEVSVSIRCPGQLRLPKGFEVALYRIAQEALSNAVRHGKATHVFIRVRLAHDCVSSVVRDDGMGFRVTSVLGKDGRQGLGIRGIFARVKALDGECAIRSTIGRGTRLEILIPLKRPGCRNGSETARGRSVN